MQLLPVPPDSPRFAEFAALDPRTPVERQAAAGRLFDRYGRRRHWLLVDDGRPVGRLTASVHPEVRTPGGGRVGGLGDLVFPDDRAALDRLLDPALEWLRQEGVAVARAPVTYHTWYPFRFVVTRSVGGGERPPFPGEPWHPPHHPTRFAAAGFAPSATYVSGASAGLAETVAANRAELDAFAESDLALRPFDPRRLAAELPRLHALVMAAFRSNFSFGGIDREEFRFIHEPVLTRLDPRLFVLCEDPARPLPETDGLAGFLLTLPHPGEPGTVILKTLAVHPHYRGRGLGPVLIARAHEAALAAGHQRAIHALMREGQRPATVSARAVPVFRRYALLDRAP
jgi:GNAT superfamily N-acetyltransferase